MRYEIVPATLDHAAELAETMRPADVAEIEALGFTPASVLRHSLAASVEPLTGLADGRVVCMFGTGSTGLLSRTGFPWLLGSDLVATHARTFLRLNRAWVARQRAQFNSLTNIVDARNTEAIRWLEWLGFEVRRQPIPTKPRGVPFYQFVWGAEPCVNLRQLQQ